MSERLVKAFAFLGVSAAMLVAGTGSSAAVDASVDAKFVSSRGWVRPGEGYVFTVKYTATDAPSASLAVTLPGSAAFVSSNPAPKSAAGNTVTYDVSGQAGRIVIQARAVTLATDPEIIWKDLSATAVLTTGAQSFSSTTRGPRVTEHAKARYGDRPFPVVIVEYQDVTHCVGPGDPWDECTAAHPVEAFDAKLNSRTAPSLFQHFQDISLGQLYPQGTVPSAGKGTRPFTGVGQHKFARLAPNGTCSGATQAGPSQPAGSPPEPDDAGAGGADGTVGYSNRIVAGWYRLPGTQGFYGGDSTGHALAGALTGQGLLFGVDDGCGPTSKLAYDAASIADPDIDYNDFDSDRDGVVDFFEVIFAGDGGNGNTSFTGINNVWPHSFDMQYEFADANGQKGYVSNDQLRDALERPLWWTDATRKTKTTTNMGDALKVFVRVGPYNVNPESAFDFLSVVSHEYGHSLGLPDFYSTGSRETFGTWELMASDYAQSMTAYARQALGWIVPRPLTDGQHTIRESKFDTHRIVWPRPDGTLYELSGPNVHNADLFRVGMANAPLIDKVAHGVKAAYSGKGNDFNCPPEEGHGMLIQLPDLQGLGSATAITLTYKTLYEMEWDWDYGFVLVSIDGGSTWQSLPSRKGTTIGNSFNPNGSLDGATGAQCHARWNNGITGVSGQNSTPANPDRHPATLHYEPAVWIDDEFDLTAFKGKNVYVLLGYATDPAEAKRGWFVDDVKVTATTAAGSEVVYATSFEDDQASADRTRLFPMGLAGWGNVSSADGPPEDHAYYLELRDRISWDFDGKGEADRGPVTWEPGVSMIYTQELRGWGNTHCLGDQPCQTPVDSNPTSGSETPNLDDAAFTELRDVFNGCTHIDNYVDADNPDGVWKLPNSLKFQVTDISGLSADGSVPGSPATATFIADVNPDCSVEVRAPVLSVSAGEPDTDGAYQLSWTRPTGAAPPDTIQEATLFRVLLSDGAESGLGLWNVTIEGSGSGTWQTQTDNTSKVRSGTTSFWGRIVEGQLNTAALLTSKVPIAIPATGNTTLTYWDYFLNESDDYVAVQVSADGGATWDMPIQGTRAATPPAPQIALATEALSEHELDLAKYKGQSILLRFRMQAGAENRAGSVPQGWFVDDIKIETSNFADLAETSATTHAISRGEGTYFYRVRTGYPAGTASFRSPWSNVVGVDVEINELPAAPVEKGGNNRVGGSVTWPLLALLALAGLVRRRRR